MRRYRPQIAVTLIALLGAAISLAAAASFPPQGSGGGVTTGGDYTLGDVTVDVLLAGAGTATAPAVGWADDADGTGTGLYRVGADQVGISTAGTARAKIDSLGDLYLAGDLNVTATPFSTQLVKLDQTAREVKVVANGGFTWGPDNATLTTDTALVRVGAGNVGVVDVNGAGWHIATASEELTALSGASASTTNLVPAGGRILNVVVRVTTTITGATSFSIGDGSDVDRYGATIALTAGTTTDHSDATADPMSWSAAAQDVTLTANGSNFTGGAVRVVATYLAAEPPAS